MGSRIDRATPKIMSRPLCAGGGGGGGACRTRHPSEEVTLGAEAMNSDNFSSRKVER